MMELNRIAKAMAKVKASKVVFLVLLFGLAAWLLALKTVNRFDSDEGIIIGGAWRLYNGENIYSDFFQYLPPGSFYLLFSFWKLFSPSYLSASVLAIILLSATLVAVYLTAKKSGAGGSAILAPFLYLVFFVNWPLIGHNTFVLAPLAWSIYFFVSFLKDDSHRNLFFSALFAGFTGLFLQHRFLALAAASIVWLILAVRADGFSRTKRRLFVYALGVFLPLTSFLAFPLSEVYQDLFVIPFSGYLSLSSSGVFWILVAGFWLLAMFFVFGKERTKVESFLFLVQAFLLGSVSVRPDFLHVLSVIFPLLILCLIFLNKGGDTAMSRAVIVGLKVFLLLALFLSALALSRSLRGIDSFGSRLSASIERTCGPSPAIYSYPFSPGLYFELGKKNQTRYDSLFPGFNSEAQVSEVLALLAADPPACVVLSHDVMVGMTLAADDPISRFVDERYEKADRVGKLDIYRLK
jgi:hypothetical protein